MTNSIFTTVGFNVEDSDTQVFSYIKWGGSHSSKYILIDPYNHDEIRLQYRAKVSVTAPSAYLSFILPVTENGNLASSSSYLPGVINREGWQVWWSRTNSLGRDFPVVDEWIDVDATVNKQTGDLNISIVQGETTLLTFSGTEYTERNATDKWAIMAWTDVSAVSYYSSYDLTVDLTSVKLTLDGIDYYLKRKETNRMAEVLVQSHLNLNGNEIQNGVIQNLSTAPQNPKAGQMYFNTTDGLAYVYDGTVWINATSTGDYIFQNGIEELDGANAGQVQIKLATGDNAGNVAFTADANGLAASVAPASTSVAGVIEIATDAEFTTGTSETLAVNPKQVSTAIAEATSGMVTETGTQTLTNKTIDADDNSIVDLATGNFKSGVISTVLAGTSTASDTVLVTEAAIAKAIDDFITLGDLSVDAGSANYLEYNSTTGVLGAKVDGTVTNDSTNLVTSGAVATAINSAIAGGVQYKGAWTIAPSTTDFSGITLPVKQGYMYYVAGEGPATVDGIEWNVGDYLLVNTDVAVGGSLAGKVEKIDNTESTDIVKTNATQTLTNKTIDADDNSIVDLATGNFKSGVITTVLADTTTASATVIPTESAVANALATATDGMVTETGAQTLTNKTVDADDNTISNLELDNFKSGVVVDSTTGIAGTASASDTAVATEKAIAVALAGKTGKLTAQNAALTPVAGVATWEISNTLGTADVNVMVKEVSTNAEIITNVVTTASTITISFNASSTVAADTYRAIIIG